MICSPLQSSLSLLLPLLNRPRFICGIQKIESQLQGVRSIAGTMFALPISKRHAIAIIIFKSAIKLRNKASFAVFEHMQKIVVFVQFFFEKQNDPVELVLFIGQSFFQGLAESF